MQIVERAVNDLTRNEMNSGLEMKFATRFTFPFTPVTTRVGDEDSGAVVATTAMAAEGALTTIGGGDEVGRRRG